MSRAQISHPLNWILVLFAGAFFLLLFISITRSIIDAGENSAEATTINVLTNIIEKTKANPETRVTTILPDLTTACEDGVFQLKSGRQQRTFTTHALFAPTHLKGETTLWSEEFKLVNPITTLTYFFPHDTLYILTESVPQTIIDALSTFPLKVVEVAELSTTDLQGYSRVVVVAVNTDDLLSSSLALRKGQEAHGIWFNTITAKVKFYSYTTSFILEGNSTYVNKEFQYAAIAAQTSKQYACGLAVAETQAQFLAKINLERITLLRGETSLETCRQAYTQAKEGYENLITNGLTNARAAYLDLLQASMTLGNNGCPNI